MNTLKHLRTTTFEEIAQKLQQDVGKILDATTDRDLYGEFNKEEAIYAQASGADGKDIILEEVEAERITISACPARIRQSGYVTSFAQKSKTVAAVKKMTAVVTFLFKRFEY